MQAQKQDALLYFLQEFKNDTKEDIKKIEEELKKLIELCYSINSGVDVLKESQNNIKLTLETYQKHTRELLNMLDDKIGLITKEKNTKNKLMTQWAKPIMIVFSAVIFTVAGVKGTTIANAEEIASSMDKAEVVKNKLEPH